MSETKSLGDWESETGYVLIDRDRFPVDRQLTKEEFDALFAELTQFEQREDGTNRAKDFNRHDFSIRCQVFLQRGWELTHERFANSDDDYPENPVYVDYLSDTTQAEAHVGDSNLSSTLRRQVAVSDGQNIVYLPEIWLETQKTALNSQIAWAYSEKQRLQTQLDSLDIPDAGAQAQSESEIQGQIDELNESIPSAIQQRDRFVELLSKIDPSS